MRLRSDIDVVVVQAGRCSSHSIPSLGTSICDRCSCYKKKNSLANLLLILLPHYPVSVLCGKQTADTLN